MAPGHWHQVALTVNNIPFAFHAVSVAPFDDASRNRNANPEEKREVAQLTSLAAFHAVKFLLRWCSTLWLLQRRNTHRAASAEGDHEQQDDAPSYLHAPPRKRSTRHAGGSSHGTPGRSHTDISATRAAFRFHSRIPSQALRGNCTRSRTRPCTLSGGNRQGQRRYTVTAP